MAFLSVLAAVFLSPVSSSSPVQQPIVHIRVVSSADKRPIASRITIVDAKGRLARLQVAKAPHLAIREGVVYTATGAADVGVAPGEYTVYATRGPMYSLAQKKISVGSSGQQVSLTLTKEVDLPGYVSCDTHMHTLEFSGHGDASGQERLVTLAAEHIELPVATEHNRHVDYAPLAKATGTGAYLTPVVGNEVTTPNGHFNIFPIGLSTKPPMFNTTDRSAVLAGIRAVPEVRFVTFNHTNDTHSTVRPGHPERFHILSGESLDGQPWDVDGMEVINSSAQQSDPMRLFRIWFALLNSGKPVVAVGASDSHEVNLYMVGQARTYISSTAKRPDRIDVEEACRNLKAGRALVSQGLITEMWVLPPSPSGRVVGGEDRPPLSHSDGRGTGGEGFTVGDLATGLGDEVKVRVRVRGPKWMAADRLEVHANGGVLVSRPIVHNTSAIVKADYTFTLPRPRQDLWLAAIASGPGFTDDSGPFWQLSRPYQPTLAHWEPRLIGATNPIRLDGDGDGKYTSPRDYAVRLVDAAKGDLKALMVSLEPHDPAVMVQAAALLRQRGTDLSSGPVQQALNSAHPAVVQAFKAYQILLKREKE